MTSHLGSTTTLPEIDGKFELLATGNFVPSEDASCGGELTRACFGGGDLLYRMSAEEIVRDITAHDRLTLHYNAQSKGDFWVDIILEVFVWLIILGTLALVLAGVAPTNEGSKWLLLRGKHLKRT